MSQSFHTRSDLQTVRHLIAGKRVRPHDFPIVCKSLTADLLLSSTYAPARIIGACEMRLSSRNLLLWLTILKVVSDVCIQMVE